MKIAVDCDDVLAEFMPAFVREYNYRYGANYTPEQITPIIEHWEERLGKDITQRLWGIIKEDVLAPRLSTVGGVVEGIKSLSDLELYVLTGRSETPDKVTRRWLKNHFGDVFRDVLYGWTEAYDCRLSKGKLCVQNGITVAVEDHPYTAANLAEHGIRTIVLAYDWNVGIDKEGVIKRVHNWPEIVQTVREFSGRS